LVQIKKCRFIITFLVHRESPGKCMVFSAESAPALLHQFHQFHAINLLDHAMSSVTAILSAARARHHPLPYAGAITPQEAHALLEADPRVKLVDVRTNAERDWVGRVAIPEAQHLAVQWTTYPGGVANPDFLQQLAAGTDQDDVLLFLCRSGVRSRHAAKLATEHGYRNCFDILQGFEGDKDDDGHRKHVSGWCQAGLPWLGA
jgi:rhodanese-related sulfurtransferase